MGFIYSKMNPARHNIPINAEVMVNDYLLLPDRQMLLWAAFSSNNIDPHAT